MNNHLPLKKNNRYLREQLANSPIGETVPSAPGTRNPRGRVHEAFDGDRGHVTHFVSLRYYAAGDGFE